MKAYIVSINDNPNCVASSWRKAYLMMCEYFSKDADGFILDGVITEETDDRFTWVSTRTGELVFAAIDEFVMDDNALMPHRN